MIAMAMQGNTAQDEPAGWSASALMSEYIATGRLAEVVFLDPSGQVITVHDRLRDLFCRAGRDFLLLTQGLMLPADHIITLDGRPVASPLQSRP
jgi:Rho-binding antiterminator